MKNEIYKKNIDYKSIKKKKKTISCVFYNIIKNNIY